MAAALLLLALGAAGGATCEQQDYEAVPGVLEVSASNGVMAAPIPEPLEHETITRHAIDYRVTNTSQETVEVVVFAQSSVNGVARATGNDVHRLEGTQEASGRISDLTLEIGNALDLELQCCGASQCASKDVLCPTYESEDDPAREAPPYVCVDACFDRGQCREECSPDPDCEAMCEDDVFCIEACPADADCVDDCEVDAVTCVASCLALYRRCGGESASTVSGNLPCAFCDGGTGMCSSSGVSVAGVEIEDSSGSTVSCAPSCVHYPAACVTECEVYAPDGDRDALLDCAQSCISLFQTWCDRDSTAIDPTAAVPCCFSESCEASLEAVIKLGAVECLDDSVCGSGRQCNRLGMCENRLREQQSSCQLTRVRGSAPSPWWLAAFLVGLVSLRLRRRERRGAKRPRRIWLLGAMALSLGLCALVPEVVQAEPRGFRRTRSSLVAGATAGNFFGGDVGDAARAGLGLAFSESIQSGYVGASMRLSFALHPTSNQDLPFDEGVQLFGLTVGPRGVLPMANEVDLFVYLQPEYSFLGLQSNTLVRSTANKNALHGVGASLGAQLFAGGLLLETSVSASWLWEVDSVFVVGGIGLGFSGIL